MRTYTLAPLLAATLLAGCSSTTLIDAPSAPSNAPPSDSAGQKAFVFESGTVPIGDFDPFTLAPEDYFDPCNDITEEEFRRAGFTGEIKRSTDGEIDSMYGTSACSFAKGDAFSSVELLSVDGNEEFARSARTLLPEFQSEVLPEIYVYNDGIDYSSLHVCIAQIDTERGAIGAFFNTVHENVSFDEHCQIAIEALESLYLLQS
ncbi:DUF3558 family protein [Corynebacterium sp. NML120713]|uniref:DUF3558 family protein n=1 Tax=Corynebacterium sp. NML120713 TaxID=1906332 RepID=UPI0008FB3DFB|nr:DUF3558 family protein [Corynebacterium sp. NML120713]OIR41228.1 hypothetical protein BJP06_10265 [Corynebacterium sp. NML120713]